MWHSLIMMRVVRYYLLFLYAILLTTCMGQSLDFQFFKNMSLGAKASTVHCFAQDSLGMLWLGSNNGLYSYDGYALHAPTAEDAAYQTFIYAITVLDARYMALGTGNGVSLYNYREDRYEAFPAGGPADVRAMLLLGDKLWIGSLTGLYCYDTKRKILVDYKKNAGQDLGNQAIYALSGQGDSLLVGTYNGLFRLTASSGKTQRLPLPGYRAGSNQFVNSILPMPATHSAFIGTEYGLYVYDTRSGQLAKATVLQQHPIKSMASKDAGTLLIGTDDGLFVYRPKEGALNRIKHDSRNSHALANNIVWSIFKDRSENIWLGTDLGFSLWSKQQTERRYPIYQFTNSADGNRFYKILKDRAGWYWLGGDNGLIRTRGLGTRDFQSYWYRMDAPGYPLPHNRIRDIYQDRDGLLWMASDGGVNLFNPQSQQFRSFTIVDHSGRRNAKWAYDMLEDAQGNLWVATYMGGIFMLEKKQLLASSGTFVARDNYNQTQGLLADFANQLLDDGQGNIWALFYNRGISRIDRHSGRVSELKNKGQSLERATFMVKDREGAVWVGEHGTLRRIQRNGNMTQMHFDPVGRSEVTAMVEVGEAIWVATSVGVWRVDKAQLKAELLHYGQDITSMYYDREQQEVLLGGINEIAVLNDRPLASANSNSKSIVLTAMYVNNEAFGNKDFGLRYSNELTLGHQQNNLRLEFSDFDYGNHLGYRLAYAFKGRNETWIPLERGDNKVLLSNLAPGSYELQLAKVDFAGTVRSQIDVYKINIQYPWYASWWAKLGYALAALGLLLWILNFFRVRNTLKWERRERHKVLELTRMKMDFLTAISHELKTPLSLILAPVSQLILQTKSADKKRQLEGVHRNALKINNLIQEVMAFEQAEKQEADSATLLTSQIDLLTFVRDMMEEWRQSPTCAQLQFSFVATMDSLPIQTDVSKLSSILNNLLSNACKYNRAEQGRIDIVLEQRDGQVLLSVSDTGMGIPAEDLPYVFSKFFRSPSSEVRALEGTGVGLYLVKSYADQLGWDIQIRSTLGQGTTVTMGISHSDVLPSPPSEGPAAGSKRKLLIVEDNVELAAFLHSALEANYSCQVLPNGREALQLLQSHSILPDIIISDAMMPEMGGLEMVKKIRQQASMATIPVILLTAKNDEQMQRDWVAAGVDAFIAKPFDLEVLKMQLLQLLGRRDKLTAQLRLDEISKPTLGIQKESPDEKFLSKVTLLIEENMDDAEFSVQRLSEEADVPAKQLYRKIKQLTGYTPVEYIRNIRMKKAALLLQQKKFTVAEVMYMVGYSNASYFSKCFQAAFGMTPKGYLDKEG